MSGCHDPEVSNEPQLIKDLRKIVDDILSLTGQIEGLGEKVSDHWDLNYKAQENLSNRLSKFEDFAGWIDEYRRGRVLYDDSIQNKLTKLESTCVDISLIHNEIKSRELWQKGCEALISDIQRRVKDIEYCLFHIVELPSELDIRLQDVERKLDGLGNSFVKLRKDFEGKLDVDYKRWMQYFSEVHPQKKPHKCPICEGFGSYRSITLNIGENNIDTTCKSCEGKGIVWG